MALTPKPREALLAAFHAPGVTLGRCCGGFFNSAAGPQSPKVTVRTANALAEFGLAAFNDPVVPSYLTLTPEGIAEARRIQAEASPPVRA